MDPRHQTQTTIEMQDILRLLPHRYPFLLVDRIVEVRGDESCIGIKNVTANEPFFQGHFPGQPVMPGVLLIEAMAQTAGAICALSRGYDNPPKSVLFLTIDLCSLCLRINDPSLTMFVAGALFGDGAAGLVLRSHDGESRGSGSAASG